MASGTCDSCDNPSPDLEMCEICEEWICPECRVREEQAHIQGAHLYQAASVLFDCLASPAAKLKAETRLRRLICLVQGTTTNLSPFVRTE